MTPNIKALLAAWLMSFASSDVRKTIAARADVAALLDGSDADVTPHYKAGLAKAILNTANLEKLIYLSVAKAVYRSLLYSPDVLTSLKRLIVASIIGNDLLTDPEKRPAVEWKAANPPAV